MHWRIKQGEGRRKVRGRAILIAEVSTEARTRGRQTWDLRLKCVRETWRSQCGWGQGLVGYKDGGI